MFKNMKNFVVEGNTEDIQFRKESLIRLKEEIIKNKSLIEEALYSDLGKSSTEASFSEIMLVVQEINDFVKNLDKWSKKKRRKTPLIFFKSRSYNIYSPYGVVLIISPWNYPFNLTMTPLIGAVGAGNSVVIKTSSSSAATSEIMEKIINSVFIKEHVQFFKGGEGVNEKIMNEKFDYIFFTGGKETGRKVYEKAARDLTPVTLELGGKSPCVVDETADIEISAKRITWGKFLNSGQTCIAPDYILAHDSISAELIESLKKTITEFYGENPLESPDYSSIISKEEFNRLKKLIVDEGVEFKSREDKLKIQPVILESELSSSIMDREIFGPILPIIKFNDFNEVINVINKGKTPLAAYLFSKDRNRIDLFLKRARFGGGAVNDTVSHLVNTNMPFGGFGESGIGKYHGKESFYTFSHEKSILEKSYFPEIKLRYPPFKGKEKFFNFFIK